MARARLGARPETRPEDARPLGPVLGGLAIRVARASLSVLLTAAQLGVLHRTGPGLDPPAARACLALAAFSR